MKTPTNAEEDLADPDITDVARVLAGDVNAFEGIVRRWQGPLINMAWRYCRDRGRAEDLAQEAFIRAWRGLAQWRRESSFQRGSSRLRPMCSAPILSAFPPSTCRGRDCRAV